MLGLSSFAFAAPWALAALVALPVLWWLLRVTPPAPRRVRFPAIALLADLAPREETPARTPWWLMALRLLLCAVVIAALAEPLLNPGAALPGGGPLLLVIDNGWAAARDWPSRRRAIEDALREAERAGRPVAVLTTAPTSAGEEMAVSAPLPAAEARRRLQALEPSPWPVDRARALNALRGVKLAGGARVLWLADGLGDADAAPSAAAQLATALQRLGPVRVLEDGTSRPVHLLAPPFLREGALIARVLRADTKGAARLGVRLGAADGRLLARQTVTLEDGRSGGEARLEAPAELLNEAAHMAIEDETTAGAVALIDERWRRRPVGLVSGRVEGETQPLLSDLHYLTRALEPTNEVRQGEIGELLKRELAVLVLSDIGALSATDTAALTQWVRNGGVLLRFAGPRLAQNADSLVPARLRRGDRALGGAMSWTEPAGLQPFDARGPFAGLSIPAEVLVRRQVLAEPTAELADHTWARLADGTPLVTADKRGDGWIVLVHTTAGPEWSNLALSGLFVDMLRRLVALSRGVAAPPPGGMLEPLETLDGFGRLGRPPATVLPLAVGAAERVEPSHPPGFYGAEEARRALNLGAGLTRLAPLGPLPSGVSVAGYDERGEVALKAPLLAVALALAVVDLVIALALRGLIGRWGNGRAAAARTLGLGLGLLAMAPLFSSHPARAWTDADAIRWTAEPTLAYALTGDAEVDELSRAGLEGLVDTLNRRTAVEAASAQGVDPEHDELAFFPLLYWPVVESARPLSDAARARVNAYLRNGGTILFDTRDQDEGPPSDGGGALRRLLAGIDVPPLSPPPDDHVLTKSFYLLRDFPGRLAGGTVWVEAREGRTNDGVSPVVIGANDWAGAWAVDPDSGRPLRAVVPGGEAQREMALRFGVNLVMYTLTGNYKADQVHVPAILERLGQ